MGTKQRRRYGSSRARQIYENHFKGKDGSYYINSIQATSSPETATTAVQPVTEAPTEAPETTSSAEAASETQPVSDGTDASDTAAESDTASADTAAAA